MTLDELISMSDLIVNPEKTFACEDYLKLEDNQDYEVIGGKLILVPKPMPYHQEIVGRSFYFR